ncbi:MAG: tetratricopeptide repeat protein [Clostridiaceae bacterium]|jgi:tetratricopeptide (TPR) repeat protein|nr:tetratricopeptide repeat protein [Clostridiaceae bacterium]
MMVFAVAPIILIVFLFRWNTWFGILGIFLYLLLIIAVNRSSICFIMGKIQYGKGNIDNALKLFKKAVKNGKASVEVMASYGFVLFKAGRLQEAEEVLVKAIDSSRTADQKNLAKSNFALVLWKKGNLDEAIAMLKEVISEYKTTAVYGSLGYMSIEKGDLDDAMKINLEAYEYNSDEPIIIDNLAHLYHLTGDMKKSSELFGKLMEKKPHFPEAYYDYGQYLEDAERYEEAVEMYNKALSCPFNFNSTITKEQVSERRDKVKSLIKNT